MTNQVAPSRMKSLSLCRGTGLLVDRCDNVLYVRPYRWDACLVDSFAVGLKTLLQRSHRFHNCPIRASVCVNSLTAQQRVNDVFIAA